MKVREVVADMAASTGATTLFSLMGATNQELMCDLASRCGLRLVHARHEAGAVGMADGYYRFSGRVGIATVTAGPGVTNTATSLAVARAHGSPVLLLAGDVARGDVRNPQYFEQESFTRLCAGDSATITGPRQTGPSLAAARAALTESRPFVLHLPVDVQQAEVGHAELSPRWRTEPGIEPAPCDSEALGRAVTLLRQARHPLILAGRGAIGACDALGQLADKLGAALVTTLRAAGSFTGHGREAGVAGPMGDGRAKDLLASADLVLAVGTSMHPLATGDLRARPALPVLLRIDIRAPVHDDLPWEVDMRGPASAWVSQLADHVMTSPSAALRPPRVLRAPGFPSDRPAHRTPDRPVHPLNALDALCDLLPPRRLLVVGGGHASLGACQRLTASAAEDFTCVSTDFGAIGQALPVAIGACLARPGQRVFHVTADGEFMMALGEFHTAVRYRLPLTVLVFNDNGFGQERHNLVRAGRDGEHATHPSPDLAAIARSLGAVGYRITRYDELGELKRAFGHREGVVLVDVAIDPGYLNPASADVAAAMSAA